MPQASRRYLRFVTWPLFLASVILYVFAFAAHVERNPLRADEVDFFRCMRSVVNLGRPLYYAGEINLPVASLLSLGSETLAGQPYQFYRFKPETGILKETFFAVTDGDSRYTYCLWHPPLYVYLGALFLRVVDLPTARSSAFRYVHLLYVALMFVGLALLIRELYRPRWFLGLSLASLFLACSGLAVVASVLIDYNGALAMCSAVWLVWAFLRADLQPRRAAPAVVLVALTFGVGLGVGTALAAGLLLWAAVFHRSALLRHALVILAGVALFLVAFWLSARVGHFPFSQPFLHNLQRAALQTPLSDRLTALVRYAGWYVEEISSLVIAVALLLCALRVLQARFHSRDGRLGDARASGLESRVMLAPSVVVVTLVSQAALSADAYGFPKYIAFALPLLFAFLGGELAALISGPRLRWPAVALAVVLIVTSGRGALHEFQRPGGTVYMAGDDGFLAAADAVAANLQPGEAFLGSKDTSFYADRKFVQWTGKLWTDPALLERAIAGKPVRLAEATQGQVAGSSRSVAAWLAEHAVLIASHGDHRIYRLR